MTVSFAKSAFADYQAWATADRKVYDRINALIQDIARSPFSGLGKPEPLKHELSGYWSRRITREHRLVYKVKDDNREPLKTLLVFKGSPQLLGNNCIFKG